MNTFAVSVGGIHCAYRVSEPPESALTVSHCHDKYEILYVVGGEGRYIVEGNEYEMRPGSLMVIRPFEYHCVAPKDGVLFERYVLSFYESSLPNDVKALLLHFEEGVKGGNFYSQDTVSRTLVSAFERIATVKSLPENKKSLYLGMLVSEIIILLSTSSVEERLMQSGELGARVIRYLNENIEKNITLDDLAKRFFVSKYYLCRAFKRHNGISIHGYLTQKRIMYAKQLIESGESASSAAYRVGFGDYSAFYRAYVKLTGSAPMLGRGERSRHELSDIE